MKIAVTQKHIDRGRLKLCYFCPVALAIKAVLPPDWSCAVSPRAVIIERTNGDMLRMELPLPNSARYFVDYFDCGMPVEPFEFELDFDPAELA